MKILVTFIIASFLLALLIVYAHDEEVTKSSTMASASVLSAPGAHADWIMEKWDCALKWHPHWNEEKQA